jgi:hypothetical protein
LLVCLINIYVLVFLTLRITMTIAKTTTIPITTNIMIIHRGVPLLGGVVVGSEEVV